MRAKTWRYTNRLAATRRNWGVVPSDEQYLKSRSFMSFEVHYQKKVLVPLNSNRTRVMSAWMSLWCWHREKSTSHFCRNAKVSTESGRWETSDEIYPAGLWAEGVHSTLLSMQPTLQSSLLRREAFCTSQLHDSRREVDICMGLRPSDVGYGSTRNHSELSSQNPRERKPRASPKNKPAQAEWWHRHGHGPGSWLSMAWTSEKPLDCFGSHAGPCYAATFLNPLSIIHDWPESEDPASPEDSRLRSRDDEALSLWGQPQEQILGNWNFHRAVWPRGSVVSTTPVRVSCKITLKDRIDPIEKILRPN